MSVGDIVGLIGLAVAIVMFLLLKGKERVIMILALVVGLALASTTPGQFFIRELLNPAVEEGGERINPN